MIKLLGFKRTLILGILLGVNGILLLAYMLWASPQTQMLDGQLNGLRAQISTLQTNIQNTKTDLEMLQNNIGTYEQYVARGFFQEQDRFGMSRALEDIKTEARIQGFSFAVGDIREISNNDARQAGKRLLHSRVSIDRISAPLDINFFDLISLIETTYPIHARIHAFELTRAAAVTPETLQKISREPFTLITGQLTFDWLSLSDIPQATGAAPPPGGFR